MSKRKYVHHGEKRKVVKSKAYAAACAGAQTLYFSDADLLKISTVASCCGVQITVCVSDIYPGQEFLIDLDSNDACDTLTVKLNGTSSSVDVATAPTYNQRNLLKVVVLDVTDGSEKGSLSSLNADIT